MPESGSQITGPMFSPERIARWRREILETLGVVRAVTPPDVPVVVPIEPAGLLPATPPVAMLPAPRFRRRRSHTARNAFLAILGAASAYSAFFFTRLDLVFPALASRLPWPAAYVEGRTLSLGDLRQGARALERFYEQRGQQKPNWLKLERQALVRFLQDQVLNAGLERTQLKVPDAVVDQALASVAQGFATTAEFDNYLQSEYGWTEQDFKNELLLPFLKRQMLEQKFGQDPALAAAAQAKANDIWTRITSGATSFVQAAAVDSDDSATSALGGDLGWVDRSAVDPELFSVVNSLAQGAVSQPVKTAYGYELVTVLEVLPGNSRANDALHLAHILVKPLAVDRWLDQQVRSMLVIRLLPV